jgi:hypothetical protein
LWKDKDKKEVLISMYENLDKIIEPNEHYFIDFARRTQNYILNHFANAMISRFTLDLRDFSDFLFRDYRIIVVLD